MAYIDHQQAIANSIQHVQQDHTRNGLLERRACYEKQIAELNLKIKTLDAALALFPDPFPQCAAVQSSGMTGIFSAGGGL